MVFTDFRPTEARPVLTVERDPKDSPILSLFCNSKADYLVVTAHGIGRILPDLP